MSTRLAWLRFVLACLLFAGWIGWLGFLAATRRNPVVLSRPQLLVSDVDVVAEVDDPDRPVVVHKVLVSRAGLAFAAGDTLTVTNLKDCRRQRRSREEQAADVPKDWTGPGLYLLPLRARKNAPDTFEVVVVPPSPGYPREDIPTPRIYPATPEVLAEYEQVAR